MSGRAGRRGLDDRGTVIIYMNDVKQMPEPDILKGIVDHPGELLESKFKLTYGIILNLLTAKDMNVIEMLKLSYGENAR